MNFKRIYLILALLVFNFFSTFSQNPYSWLSHGGGINARIYDIVPLPDGSFVTAGTADNGPVVFGNNSTLNGSGSVGFISKFDETGQCQWTNGVMAVGNNSFVRVNLVERDSQSNIYMAGMINDSVSFGGSIIQTTTSHPKFLAKYDSSGNLLWQTQFSSPYLGSSPDGLAIDVSGNVYMTGTYDMSIDFGNGVSLSSPPGSMKDIFLVKISPFGQAIWAKKFAATGQHQSTVLKINSSNRLFIGGIYQDTIRINSSTLTSPQNGSFIASLDTSGNTIWVQNISNVTWFPDYEGPTGIAANSQNECYVLFPFRNVLNWDGTAIIAPTQSTDLTLVKISATGNILWHKEIYGPNAEAGGEICLNSSGELVISGYYPDSLQIGPNIFIPSRCGIYSAVFDSSGSYLRHYSPDSTFAGIAYGIAPTSDGGHIVVGKHHYIDIGSILHVSNGITGTILKAQSGINTITGNVFRDFNGNGNRDAGEYGYQGVIVQANTGPYFSMSRQSGDYSMYPDTGSYTLTIPNVPAYHTLLTASNSATFSTYNNTDSLNDFALEPMPGVQDLVVDMVPHTFARLTGETHLALAYANVGTDSIQNATLRFTCDTLFNMVSSSVAPTSYVNDTAEWVIPNIRPGDYGLIRFSLSITDTTAALGDSARFFVDFLPTANDTTPLDNHDEYRDTLRAAYDPNDKLVSQTTMYPDEAANRDYLTYTIRFQNTGTDTAFTVIIEDTLDANLDLTSLKMVGASHAYEVSMHHRSIKFIFNQIMLPDSNVNEPASHGFIRYRIRPVQGLGIGDEMRNTAHIYFDSNPAIVTNTTLTRVDTAASVSVRPPVEPDFLTLYPNPNNGEFYLQTDFDNREPVRVEMMDLQGRKVMTDRYTCPAGRHAKRYSVQDLPAGVYFLRLQAQGKVAVRKVVVR